ncbi:MULTISPECIES: crotonase/enoyl-CoA hydratase family protein [unclassified Paraburkholderia]|uniref:crotonase/enoyl-CoA hydratase family protein n=1 Tax=unclassified Paraburkholderia TaxID=2615204 RepID=UPI0016201551|nr:MULTISPECIES: crotonase/enoyl-CoA hydratase family protein [unclassified Paraburkholderia]MBB5443071.1 enoyl-CoA hydratase/carnithine racemase [Paraburkholderia sp. WSM4177]MBB5483324.1 enoyl-CoA hydratase/carnithine racemase [Paraburkholderia sp. WSM4180]
MEKSLVSVSRQKNVLLVGLNRPEKRNAMPKSMLLELREIFSTIPDDIGAAVLYSTSQHFCSGLDLTEVKGQSVIDCFNFFRQWHEVFHLIQFGKVPVIAAISGAAIGAGLEIATACHIRVVDESAYFSLPEGARGLYVGVGASVRFPRLAGTALMMDMMLTRRPLAAAESVSRGVAQYLVPTGAAVDKAVELATIAAQNLPMTNHAIIHALPRIVEQGHDEGLYTEALIASVVQSGPETSVLMDAFLNRKKA